MENHEKQTMKNFVKLERVDGEGAELFNAQVLFEPYNEEAAKKMASAGSLDIMMEKKVGCKFIMCVFMREEENNVMAFGHMHPLKLALTLAKGLPDELLMPLMQNLKPARLIVEMDRVMKLDMGLEEMFKMFLDLRNRRGDDVDDGES